MKNTIKLTPQRLLQMIDPAEMVDAIEEAAAMFGDIPFALIISDPRSMHGCMLIAAACEPPPEDDATARERAMRIVGRVERAQRDIARTGRIAIEYSCAPLDVLGAHLDELGLSEFVAEVDGADGYEPRVIVFSVEEAAVASIQLRPRAIGEA